MPTSKRTQDCGWLTSGRRRASLVAGILFLVAAFLLLSACGSNGNRVDRNSSAGGGTRVFHDSTFGFHFVYPAGFHAHAVLLDYGMVSFRGAVATNLSTRRPFFEANAHDLSKLPAGAVVFLLEHRDGGPGPALEIPEAHFPLRAASLAPVRGVTLAKSASWRQYGFSANGWNLVADVYVGPRASQSDRAAIWRIVSSLRFRSLSSEQRTGSGFLVLKKKDSYPVASVKRMNANAFLVRAAHGFYGIGGMAMGLPSQFPCPIRFDKTRFAFVCKDGSRRWDRMGRPLWKDASDRDYLGVLVAVKVGQDGHVLFCACETAFGDRRLERRYWGASAR
jgi:hypothetical protein